MPTASAKSALPDEQHALDWHLINMRWETQQWLFTKNNKQNRWTGLHGGFLKWWYPHIIHFNRVFHYFHHPFWDTTILGNPQIGTLQLFYFKQVSSSQGNPQVGCLETLWILKCGTRKAEETSGERNNHTMAISQMEYCVHNFERTIPNSKDNNKTADTTTSTPTTMWGRRSWGSRSCQRGGCCWGGDTHPDGWGFVEKHWKNKTHIFERKKWLPDARKTIEISSFWTHCQPNP